MGKRKKGDFVLSEIMCDRIKLSCLGACREPGEGQGWAGLAVAVCATELGLEESLSFIGTAVLSLVSAC